MTDNDPLPEPWKYRHMDFQRRMYCPVCSEVYYMPTGGTGWICLEYHYKRNKLFGGGDILLVDLPEQLGLPFGW
jgi:hypothetical protein